MLPTSVMNSGEAYQILPPPVFHVYGKPREIYERGKKKKNPVIEITQG